MHKFTEEQIKFIREIASGRYAVEITEMEKHYTGSWKR